METKIFKNRPKEIEVMEFSGTENSIHSKAQFRQVDNIWQIYNKLHDTWINIKVGDFYRIDLENDFYPIDSEYLKANYTQVFKFEFQGEYGYADR